MEEVARQAMPGGGYGLAAALYTSAHRSGTFDPSSVGASASSSASWRSRFSLSLLDVAGVTEEEGEHGVTRKAILTTREGYEVECVSIPMRRRGGDTTTLCLSTQVGCAMGCAFCETGKMGLLRSLTGRRGEEGGRGGGGRRESSL